MKAGEKTINLLACIAFVLVVGLGMQAWELLTERQLTVEQIQKLQRKLTQQIRFADEHSDYKTYKIKLLDKQKKLEQQVEHNLNLNNLLQRLQKQAQAQSILLNSMQMEGNPVPLQQGLQLQTVKISVVGNFYGTYYIAVASQKDIVANKAVVLFLAIIICKNNPRTNVAICANINITQIRHMACFCVVTQNTIF